MELGCGCVCMQARMCVCMCPRGHRVMHQVPRAVKEGWASGVLPGIPSVPVLLERGGRVFHKGWWRIV